MKKKKSVLILSTLALLLTFSAGASAASTLERIQANLNHGITFLLNGSKWQPTDSNGKKVTAISYQGTTYVPLRAVSEATGAEVEWDGTKQQISLSTKPALSKGQKVPFSADNVTNFKWSYYESGITWNKADLLFGETQYSEGFVVNKVTSAGQGVAFKIPKGTTKVGVLLGFKFDKEVKNNSKVTYTITDKNEQSLASGEISNNSVVNNELVLPSGTTELYVKFKTDLFAGSDGRGFLLWDESWLEN